MSYFLVENWHLIVACFLTFISILIQVLKKRPVVDSLDSYLKTLAVSYIPLLIKSAESKFVSGSDKKNYVLQEVVTLCKHNLTGLTTNDVTYIQKVCSEFIEQYLSTPQKKEV